MLLRPGFILVIVTVDDFAGYQPVQPWCSLPRSGKQGTRIQLADSARHPQGAELA